ncbi:MAG: iron-sulfur cluster assembly accessory protein [Proteobacteria bacterium]|nr:iron-sulfur cluster assembly accessory protein [Pseudomonadota bacterium]
MAIQVSEAARQRLLELFAKHPEAKALRIGVRGGGCSGFSYQFELESAEAQEQDKVFDFGEVRLYVDNKSYFYLNGSELDFVDELMGRRFQFKNPNVKSTCGCGDSISF